MNLHSDYYTNLDLNYSDEKLIHFLYSGRDLMVISLVLRKLMIEL